MLVARSSAARRLIVTKHRTRGRLIGARLRADMNANSHLGMTTKRKISQRIQETQSPTVVLTRKFLSGVTDALSLGQGFVYWEPPNEAMESAQLAVKNDPMISVYGPAEGLPELRERLREKISTENGLHEYEVMVTAGANQAFVNCLLTLCDQGDGVVLFKPYYFDHAMALQMTGSSRQLLEGPCDPHTMLPDLDWLERRCQQPDPPRVAVIISPNNPTGAVMSREGMERAAEICRKHGVWLIMDNAYEYFTYNGLQHHCIAGPHILHIFSFSKSYGMMGWRIGYIAYPKYDGDLAVEQGLVKVQDAVVVCATQMSQHLALGCLSHGQKWVQERVQTLDQNRAAALDALTPLGRLGNGIYGGQGALYLWAKLPDRFEDDESVVEWLVKEHRICVIPGSSCGTPGFIRVAFANQPYGKCLDACKRLKRGLEELVETSSLSV